MAATDQSISQLTELLQLTSADYFVVLDTLDTTQSPSGTTKRINSQKTAYSPATKVVSLAGQVGYADFYAPSINSSSSLQSAINAATGGSLYIKAGTYDIDTTLTIPNNIKIITDGWNTIFRMKNNSNTTCISNSDHTNSNSQIYINGLQIDMNSTNNTTIVNSKGIDFANVKDSCIENVYVHDIRHAQGKGNVAIGLNKTYNCIVRNNKIFNVGDYGIASNGMQECKIINNYIQNPAGHGISVEHGDFGGADERPTGNVVMGNTVYYDANETLNTQQGIKIGNIDNSIISNNVLYCTNLNGGRGITSAEDGVGNSSNTNFQTRNVISGNTIYGFSKGIYFDGGLGDTVVGNTITMPYIAIIGAEGIHITVSVTPADPITTSQEIQITGNTITEQSNSATTSGAGIVIDGGSTYIAITGNTINNCSSNSVAVIGGCNYIAFTGNMFRDSNKCGIYLGANNSSGSSYCVITGNFFSGNSRNANGVNSDIELHGATLYTTIVGNSFFAPNVNQVLYAVNEVDTAVDYTHIAENAVQATSSGTFNHIQGANSTIKDINIVTTRGPQISSINPNGANLVLTHLGAANPKKFIRTRGGTFQIIDNGYSNALLSILDGGRTGLKGVVSPTAWLHLPAGVTTVNGSPLKLTSGTNLAAPEIGAFEYDGTHLYFTTDDLVRHTII